MGLQYAPVQFGSCTHPYVQLICVIVQEPSVFVLHVSKVFPLQIACVVPHLQHGEGDGFGDEAAQYAAQGIAFSRHPFVQVVFVIMH